MIKINYILSNRCLIERKRRTYFLIEPKEIIISQKKDLKSTG